MPTILIAQTCATHATKYPKSAKAATSRYSLRRTAVAVGCSQHFSLWKALSGRKELYRLLQEGLEAEAADRIRPSDQVIDELRREVKR